MVLAVGAGSLMFSHVNDSGFWMAKEYFNLSLKETIMSWTLMEGIVGIVGIIGVLMLEAVFYMRRGSDALCHVSGRPCGPHCDKTRRFVTWTGGRDLLALRNALRRVQRS